MRSPVTSARTVVVVRLLLRLLLRVVGVVLLLVLVAVAAVAVRVEGVEGLRARAAAAEEVRVEVRVVPEAARPLPPAGLRLRPGRGPRRELARAVALPPRRGGRSRRGPRVLAAVEVGVLPRLALAAQLLRLPAQPELPDVGEADLVEEAEVLLGRVVVEGGGAGRGGGGGVGLHRLGPLPLRSHFRIISSRLHIIHFLKIFHVELILRNSKPEAQKPAHPLRMGAECLVWKAPASVSEVPACGHHAPCYPPLQMASSLY